MKYKIFRLSFVENGVNDTVNCYSLAELQKSVEFAKEYNNFGKIGHVKITGLELVQR